MPNQLVDYYRTQNPDNLSPDYLKSLGDDEITEHFVLQEPQYRASGVDLFGDYPDLKDDWDRIKRQRKIDDASVWDEAKGSIGANIEGLKSMALGAGGMVAQKLGATNVASSLINKAQKIEDESAQEYQPTVPSYKDVDGIKSGLLYGANIAGSVLPSIGEFAVAAGVGSVLGSAAGSAVPVGGNVAGGVLGGIAGLLEKRAIKQLVKQAISTGVKSELEGVLAGAAKSALSQEAKNLIKKQSSIIAARIGGSVTGAMASEQMNTGETYMGLQDEVKAGTISQDEAANIALVVGTLKAIPDTVLPAYVSGKLAERMIGKEVTQQAVEALKPGFYGYVTHMTDKLNKHALGRAGLEFLKGVPWEGGTEGFQQFLDVVGDRYAKHRNDPEKLYAPLDDKEWEDIINSAIAGGIGGMSAVVTELVPQKHKTPEEQQREQEKKTVPDQPKIDDDGEVGKLYINTEKLTQLAQRELEDPDSVAEEKKNLKPDEVMPYARIFNQLVEQKLKAATQQAPKQENQDAVSQQVTDANGVRNETTVGQTVGQGNAQSEVAAGTQGQAAKVDGQVSPQPQPEVAAAPSAPAGVSTPVIVTREMEQALADLGYTKEQRNKLRPEDAQRIISGNIKAETTSAPPATGQAAALEAADPEAAAIADSLQAEVEDADMGAKYLKLPEEMRSRVGVILRARNNDGIRKLNAEGKKPDNFFAPMQEATGAAPASAPAPAVAPQDRAMIGADNEAPIGPKKPLHPVVEKKLGYLQGDLDETRTNKEELEKQFHVIAKEVDASNDRIFKLTKEQKSAPAGRLQEIEAKLEAEQIHRKQLDKDVETLMRLHEQFVDKEKIYATALENFQVGLASGDASITPADVFHEFGSLSSDANLNPAPSEITPEDEVSDAQSMTEAGVEKAAGVESRKTVDAPQPKKLSKGLPGYYEAGEDNTPGFVLAEAIRAFEGAQSEPDKERLALRLGKLLTDHWQQKTNARVVESKKTKKKTVAGSANKSRTRRVTAWIAPDGSVILTGSLERSFSKTQKKTSNDRFRFAFDPNVMPSSGDASGMKGIRELLDAGYRPFASMMLRSPRYHEVRILPSREIFNAEFGSVLREARDSAYGSSLSDNQSTPTGDKVNTRQLSGSEKITKDAIENFIRIYQSSPALFTEMRQWWEAKIGEKGVAPLSSEIMSAFSAKIWAAADSVLTDSGKPLTDAEKTTMILEVSEVLPNTLEKLSWQEEIRRKKEAKNGTSSTKGTTGSEPSSEGRSNGDNAGSGASNGQDAQVGGQATASQAGSAPASAGDAQPAAAPARPVVIKPTSAAYERPHKVAHDIINELRLDLGAEWEASANEYHDLLDKLDPKDYGQAFEIGEAARQEAEDILNGQRHRRVDPTAMNEVDWETGRIIPLPRRIETADDIWFNIKRHGRIRSLPDSPTGLLGTAELAQVQEDYPNLKEALLKIARDRAQNEGATKLDQLTASLAKAMADSIDLTGAVLRVGVNPSSPDLGKFSIKTSQIDVYADNHGSEQDFQNTIVHESLHAYTSRLIIRGLQDPSSLNEFEHEFVVKMQGVMEAARSAGITWQDSEATGAVALDEFIAAAMTDKAFQGKLNGIKVDQDSLWTRFRNAVSKLVASLINKFTGLIGNDGVVKGGALEAANDLVTGLLEGYAQAKEYAHKADTGSMRQRKMERGDLLAPNGKPSNLNPTQWKQVRSPEFKAWFGDWENDPANASKVVDKNGEPLVVYHGTRKAGFPFFDFNKTVEVGMHFGTNDQANDFVIGNKPNDFKSYQNEAVDTDGMGMYGLFLNIRNPMATEDAFGKSPIPMLDYLIQNSGDRDFSDRIQELKSDYIKRFDRVYFSVGEREEARKMQKDMWEEIGSIVRKMGFDGFKYVNAVEGNARHPSNIAWVALWPNQIKSAISNIGSFDADSEDIRYRRPKGIFGKRMRDLTADASNHASNVLTEASRMMAVVNESGDLLDNMYNAAVRSGALSTSTLSPVPGAATPEFIKGIIGAIFRGLTLTRDEAQQGINKALTDQGLSQGVSPSTRVVDLEQKGEAPKANIELLDNCISLRDRIGLDRKAAEDAFGKKNILGKLAIASADLSEMLKRFDDMTVMSKEFIKELRRANSESEDVGASSFAKELGITNGRKAILQKTAAALQADPVGYGDMLRGLANLGKNYAQLRKTKGAAAPALSATDVKNAVLASNDPLLAALKNDLANNDPSKLAFALQFARRRPEVMTLLSLRGIDTEYKATLQRIIELATSDREDAFTQAQGLLPKLKSFGEKGRELLDRIAEKKAEHRQLLNDSKNYALRETIWQVATPVLDAKIRELENRLSIEGHMEGRQWMAVNGAKYRVPSSPNQSIEDLIGPKTKVEELILGDKFDGAAVREHINKINEWLDAHPKLSGTAEYTLMQRQAQELGAMYLKSYDFQIRKGFGGMLVRWIGDVATKFEFTGLQSTREIARRIRLFTTLYETNLKVAQIKEFMNFDTLYGAAMEATKIGNPETFDQTIYSPIFAYLESRQDLLDQKLTIEQQLDLAMKTARDYFSSIPGKGFDWARNQVSWDAVEKLCRQATTNTSIIVHELMPKMGLKVKDVRSSGRILFRSPIGAPAFTMSRTVNESIRVMARKMYAKDGEGWQEKWIDALGGEQMELTKSAVSSLYAADRAKLSLVLAPRFTDEVMVKFVKPLAYKTGKTNFKGPEIGGVADMAKVGNLIKAYDDCGPEGAKDIIKFAELLFEYEHGKTATPDTALLADFVGQTMATFQKYATQLRNIAKSSTNDKVIKVDDVSEIRRSFLESRQGEDFPREWLVYRKFGHKEYVSYVRTMAENAAFGEDAADIAADYNRSLAELQQLRDEYVDAGKEKDAGNIAEYERRMNKDGKREARKHAEENLRWLQETKVQFDALISELNGAPQTDSIFRELVGFMSALTVQGYTTAFTDTITFAESPFRRFGLSAGARFFSGSWRHYIKDELFPSLLLAMGMQFKGNLEYQERTRMLNTVGGLVDTDALTRSRGLKAFAEKYYEETARMEMLGAIWNKSDTTWEGIKGVTGGVARRALKAAKIGLVDMGIGAAKDHNLAPTTLRLAAPFTQNSLMMHRAAARQWMEVADGVINKAIAYLKAHPADAANMNFKFDAAKLAYTGKKLKGFRINNKSFEYLNETLQRNGISLEETAREALKTGQSGINALTQNQLHSLMSLAQTEIVLNSGITTRPAWAISSKTGQLVTPLIGWSLAKTIDLVKTSRDPNLQASKKAFLQSLYIFVLSVVPVTVAYAWLRDEYEQEVLGKKANVLSIKPDGHLLMSLMDNFSRIGAFGIAGEIPNAILNPDTTREFSVDSRVFVASSIKGFMDTLKKLYNQGGTATYDTIWRQFMSSLGGSGYLQNFDAINNMLGLDNAERRVVRRINVANQMRVAGRDLGMDIRTSRGITTMPNPIKPWVSQMVLASYVNDPVGFRTAYQKALTAASKEQAGQPGGDPYKKVAEAYRSMNPLRTVFNGELSSHDYQRVISYLGDHGREVSQAISYYNSYAAQIPSSRSGGPIKPFYGSTPKQTSRAGGDYRNLTTGLSGGYDYRAMAVGGLR